MGDLLRMIKPGQIIDMAGLPIQPPPAKPIKVLLIADIPRQRYADSSVINDYVSSITQYSKNEITLINSREDPSCPDLNRFDAIIIHYSIYINIPSYFPDKYWEAVSRYSGAKVLILQDEFRWGDTINSYIGRLGIHMILSSLTTDNLPRLYSHRSIADVIKVSALPGYVAERFLGRTLPATRDRPLDVIYRGRRNEFWLGSFAQEKVEIAEKFLAHAKGWNLACDISVDEERRVQGDDWINFLTSSKAALALEGGANLFDVDGSAEKKTRAYLSRHPGADFEAVYRDVLQPYENNIVHKTITPRCLEAIALRTVLVMYPGAYRGLLEADRHYIKLERDFSNFQSVAERLKDTTYLQEMAQRAYDEVVAVPDHHFRTFVQRLDYLIDDLIVGQSAPTGVHGRLRHLFRTSFLRNSRKRLI